MLDSYLPVRPNLTYLKHQAKDFLREIRRGNRVALAKFNEHHPERIAPVDVRLAHVQLTLARHYGVANWPRLILACHLIDSIWRDDVDQVRALVLKHPHLLHEMARGTRQCNWGPPMSYAANLGRDRIVRALREQGAVDLGHALGRASLQGKIDTARIIHEMMGCPQPPDGCLAGPAYTLSVSGTEFMLERGAKVCDESGGRLAPVDVVLETDSRNPLAKHQILEAYVRHGLKLPDTPTMALHRGRIDLLEKQLLRNPAMLRQTFTHEEIYPPELGCHDEVLATQGTPLAGTTLLHMCADYDELEIARWLIEHGMDVNIRATVDADGFGGHTALFSTVVSQPNFWMNFKKGLQAAPFTQLLLDHGADPNVRASLRKQLHPGYASDHDVTMHEYRDITPLSWGRQFHARAFVSNPTLQLIATHGGGV